MWINLGLAIITAFAALSLWNGRAALELIGACGLLSLWQLYSAATHSRRRSRTILRLGGFSWSLEDFCRGWIITGETGSGKTLGGINTMLWQVSKNCPNWAASAWTTKGCMPKRSMRCCVGSVGATI